MLKEAFLIGFAKKLSRFSDDLHTVSKGVGKGKFNVEVGATDDVKKFVNKELNNLKKEITDKLDSSIKPKHILGGGAVLGLGIGAGGHLAEKGIKRFSPLRDPEERSYPYGQRRNISY